MISIELECKYFDANFWIFYTFNYSLYVTTGIGTLGYILIVGYSVTPSFWQRLYYYSQSTAPILKTPLY